jgi:hypothetical protein
LDSVDTIVTLRRPEAERPLPDASSMIPPELARAGASEVAEGTDPAVIMDR